MIRMSVMYPGGEGKTFDVEYYANKHMSYMAVGHVYFTSMDDLQKATRAHGKELFADVPNFTNITPQVQISEIVA